LAAEGKAPDLRYSNLSSLDLRKAKLKGVDLSGCYFKNADLRGMDLTGCNLHGASMENAKISGCLFPENVDLYEIVLSVERGTRIRISSQVRDMQVLLSKVQDICKMIQNHLGGK
jgi:uncharacterized protein YjbI with pentapeptide repeats